MPHFSKATSFPLERDKLVLYYFLVRCGITAQCPILRLEFEGECLAIHHDSTDHKTNIQFLKTKHKGHPGTLNHSTYSSACVSIQCLDSIK